MSVQPEVIVGSLVVAALIVFRKRLGVLNAAFWLVIWGSVVLLGEHPQFTLTYAAGIVWPEAKQLFLIPHARIHFFMSGIYAILGLILLGLIARTLLKEGRRSGWYALLFAVVIGGGLDLVMGGLWYQHGSPLYFMERPLGFGWEFLYVYLVAWVAALVLSYNQYLQRHLDRMSGLTQCSVDRWGVAAFFGISCLWAFFLLPSRLHARLVVELVETHLPVPTERYRDANH